MLEKILMLLGTGHTWSITDMAEELRISRERVVAEIEYLEQMGYIKKISFAGCNGQCKKCHACNGAVTMLTVPRIWEARGNKC